MIQPADTHTPDPRAPGRRARDRSRGYVHPAALARWAERDAYGYTPILRDWDADGSASTDGKRDI